MKSKREKRLLLALCGVGIGLINGLMGAGGGLLAVPALRVVAKLESKKAHATSLAVILPLSIFSACVYLQRGDVTLAQALPYMPGGVIGAFLGAMLLRRISAVWLRRIFGAFLLYGAYKLWMGVVQG